MRKSTKIYKYSTFFNNLQCPGPFRNAYFSIPARQPFFAIVSPPRPLGSPAPSGGKSLVER